MRNTFTMRTAVTALAMTIGTTLALAQADQPKQGQESTKQELKVSQQEMQQQVSDINKASKLIGMRVRNKQNQNLGKISDIVVDLQSGKVAYAALSVGGTLGIGDKLVAVPLEAFTPDQGQKGFVLDIEQQKLQQAPGFSQNDWPDLNAAQTGKTIGVASKGQSDPAGASGSASQQQTGAEQSEQEKQQQEQQKKQQEQEQKPQPQSPQ